MFKKSRNPTVPDPVFCMSGLAYFKLFEMRSVDFLTGMLVAFRIRP